MLGLGTSSYARFVIVSHVIPVGELLEPMLYKQVVLSLARLSWEIFLLGTTPALATLGPNTKFPQMIS